MLRPNHFVTVVVRGIEAVTARVKAFALADPEDWELPPFGPGAHIEVHLPGGYVRQYSLCGDPAERRRYRLGVLLQPQGRGGSAAFHNAIDHGSVLSVSLPKNHFPLAAGARRHILIAGGIGLTPFLSMIPVIARKGGDFILHVCARSPEDTAFRDDLAPWIAGGRVRLHHDGGDPRYGLDVRALLSYPRDGDHVYCCGPEPLMRAVQAAATHWPAGTVHFERFNAPAAQSEKRPVSYIVKLARRGDEIEVAVGQTMASALRAAGIDIDVSCEAGTCGTCRTRYLAGEPDHQDFVLRPVEREEFLMPCVSSCRAGPIVLDL